MISNPKWKKEILEVAGYHLVNYNLSNCMISSLEGLKEACLEGVEIRLCGNLLKTIDLSYVPHNVQKLDLTRNFIATVLSPEAPDDRIIEVNLAHNFIERFPRVLLELTGLRSLNLMGNRMQNFPADLAACLPNLREVYLPVTKDNHECYKQIKETVQARSDEDCRTQ